MVADTHARPPVGVGDGGHPRPRRPGRSTHPPAQWAAWAFLAPVVIYLVAFYAYPLYRNLDLSLRNYTVRSFVQGDAPFVGLDNYRTTVVARRRPSRRRVNTVVFTVVSIAFQFVIGLALAVFFFQQLPALGDPAGAVPGAVAAAAHRLGVDLVVDAQQRLRHRQLRPVSRFGLSPDQLADLAALGAGLGDHREHLDRHPVQPGGALQRPAGDPRRPVRGGRARRRERAGSGSGASPSRCCGRCPPSRCCSASSTRSRSSTSSGS